MPEETKSPGAVAGASRPGEDRSKSAVERPKPRSGPRRILGSRFLLAALVLVIGACFLRDSPLLEPSYSEIHQEYRLILSKTLELADRKASDAEWTAFEEETRRRLTPIVEELVERSSNARAFTSAKADRTSDYYFRRPLIQVGKYRLPKLIEQERAGKKNPKDIAFIEAQLERVRKALETVNLDAPPQEEAK